MPEQPPQNTSTETPLATGSADVPWKKSVVWHKSVSDAEGHP